MAINVNAANNQANQMSASVSQLRQARKQLVAYKSSITQSWQGSEVGYITTAIDQVVSEIDSAIRNIESLKSDIVSTANKIRQEEIAAAAAARARVAKQQRIAAAQSAYNDAKEELNDLNEQKQKLETRMRKASFLEKIKIARDIEELNDKIESAEKKCDSTYNALRAAKR